MLGSERPTLPDDGQLRLYSMRFCPYAARAHLVLDAKNIPYHTINIDLIQKPDWFFDANPIGKVPALQLINEPGAPILSESLIIMEYLEEKYPEPKLLPSDPLQRAQERLWIEKFNVVAAVVNRGVLNTVDPRGAWQEICITLQPIETELTRRGTVYFGGNVPNMVDYAIWPWFHRIELASDLFGLGCEFDRQKFPALVSGMRWPCAEQFKLNFFIFNSQVQFHESLLKNDKAVQKFYIPREIHVKYSESRRSGYAAYDLLVPQE